MERQANSTCDASTQIIYYMPKYDWLLFDLDNTILDFAESSRLAFVSVYDALETDMPLSDVYTIYKEINHKIWKDREAGLISHTELKTKRWKLLCESITVVADPSALNDIYFDEIKKNAHYVEHVEALLPQLAARYKMMIITNGLSEVQWSRIHDKGLERYFEHIVISDEIGCAKPAKQFFDHCADLIGHPQKDRVLVIGDTPMSDIKGGNDYGYDTCWYRHDHLQDDGQQPTYTIDMMSEMRDVLSL